jgi:ABC-type multidrug transport system fused ATPase/permease subunit
MNKPSTLKKILREIFSFYPVHAGIMFCAVLFGCVFSALSVLAIVPLGDFLLDPSLESPSRVTIYFLVLLKILRISPNFFVFSGFFIAINFFKSAAETIIHYIVVRVKYDATRGIIDNAFSAFFKARWEFFSESDQGTLLNTFIKELNSVGGAFELLANQAAKSVQFLVYLLIPLWLNLSIALITVGLSLLFCAPFFLTHKFSFRLGQLCTETANKTMGILNETFTGVRIILGFGCQAQAHERYFDSYDQHVQAQTKAQVLGASVGNLYKPLGMTAGVIALGFSMENDAQLSELVAVFWSLLSALPLLGLILQGNVGIKNLLPAFDQLELLREKAISLQEIEGKQIFQRMTEGVELKNVFFTYNGREQTLRDVQIIIEKGHMTALVGESGSGKSTITDLVLGLQIPEKGVVVLDGLDLGQWKQNSFRQRVGYVPQDPFLFNTSIRKNLLWSHNKATDEELWECCRIANADIFIKELPEGMDTVVGDRGVRLSGGQRQRIALARALLRRPELLILDEATSSLDTESERLIQKSIDHLVGGHMTMLVIAHRLSTIIRADMIYVLKKGRIIEQGSYTELLEKKGHFFQLAQDQTSQIH